jgi:hypothetical protein
MNARANPVLIGIAAGLATAILMAGAFYVPFFPQLAATTALFIAGLGFGRVAGFVAVATTAIALGAMTSSPIGAVLLFILLLPAAVMSYLAGLARPAAEIGGPDTAIAWYPLSDILLVGAVLTAVSTIVLFLPPPPDSFYAKWVDEAVQMATQMDPNITFPAEARAQLAAALKALGPVLVAIGNMVMLFAGFYFAMRILTAMKRNVRPREDIRASLRMNRLSIAVFLGGIVLMFAGGGIAIVGASFAGAVGGGFLLSGFAIVHNSMREKPWALPALVLVYIVTVIFPPLAIVIAIAGGLANPRRAIALTPHKPNDQSPTNQP